MFEKPRAIEIKYPNKAVNIIWAIPAITDIFPNSFRTLKSRLNPMINNKNATPI